MLIIIIIIIIIIYPLLVIGWQSSGNSRSQEEIKVTYPSNLRIIIIIIIIIIFFITFIQVIYNYMPETNHVYRVHSFAAVRYLQFVLHVYNNNTTEPNPVDYYIPA